MATMQALLFNAYGKSDAVYVTHIPKPVIKQDSEVLVKVRAACVNPADLLFVAGNYAVKASSFPSQAGFEGAGVIEEVGKSAAFKVGQRVHYISLGSWAEYILIDTAKSPVVPLPDGVSFEEGAQLTVNPITVVGMIQELGAKEGEYLIQNAASSALARIVIQIAKAKGIKTINIVRRDDNTAELKALGADHVINSEKEDVVKRVKEISPDGVKYALDAVVGKSGYQLSQVLAEGGLQLVYGVLSSLVLEVDVSNLLFKSAAVRGFYLTTWIGKQSKDQVKQAYGYIFEAILSKKLALPHKAFNGLKEPLAALAHSQTPGKNEKSLIVFN